MSRFAAEQALGALTDLSCELALSDHALDDVCGGKWRSWSVGNVSVDSRNYGIQGVTITGDSNNVTRFTVNGDNNIVAGRDITFLPGVGA